MWKFNGRDHEVVLSGQRFQIVNYHKDDWTLFLREGGGAVYLSQGSLSEMKKYAAQYAGVKSKRRTRTYVFDGHPMKVKKVVRSGNRETIHLMWKK